MGTSPYGQARARSLALMPGGRADGGEIRRAGGEGETPIHIK
jgi:hypothetical protein